jgi:hypothetical protein
MYMYDLSSFHYARSPTLLSFLISFRNGLMGTCWFWDLVLVTEYKLFIEEVENATTLTDLQNKLRDARAGAGLQSGGKFIGTRSYASWW